MLPTVDSFNSIVSFEVWHILVLLLMVLIIGLVFGCLICALRVHVKTSRSANDTVTAVTTTKYFFSCVIIQNDGNLIHGSYAVDVKGEYPSQDEVKMVQNSVIKHVPNAKICTIIAISRLRA